MRVLILLGLIILSFTGLYAQNEPVSRFELVFYPQFRIENKLLGQLYEYQLGVVPELRFHIYKGLRLDAGMVIPIVNQMEDEGNYIRPAMVVLSQSLNIGNDFHAVVSAGKFSKNRHGVDIRALQFFADGRLTLGANAGYTGYDEVIENEFIYKPVNTFTWHVQLGAFIKKFNSMINLNYGKYLHEDYGFRFNAVRFFGRTALGFWAMHAGGVINGGFNFAIPLAKAEKRSKKIFSVGLPKHMFWEYRGRAWPKEGRSYRVRNEYFFINNNDPFKQFNLLTFN
jgi:hypothetical protein